MSERCALFRHTRTNKQKPPEQLTRQHVSIWPATGQNQGQHHDAQRRHGTRGGQRMNSESNLPEKSAPEVDFPIERVEAEHVSRRKFTKFLCLVSGGMAVGSGWVAVKDRLFPSHRIQGEAFVCNVAEVPVGGTHPFTVPGSKKPFILIHLNDGGWRAYEQKCTHLSCAVFYQPQSDKIQCP